MINIVGWEDMIEQWKRPVPKCPVCGGPLDQVEHKVENTIEDDDPIDASMRTKDDPPPPEPRTETVPVKSALCKFCWWESARSEACCEEHK